VFVGGILSLVQCIEKIIEGGLIGQYTPLEFRLLTALSPTWEAASVSEAPRGRLPWSR